MSEKLDTTWSNEAMLRYIYRLMHEQIFIVPGDKKGTYRPAKNTSKKDCYEVLYKIQKLLRTDSYF